METSPRRLSEMIFPMVLVAILIAFWVARSPGYADSLPWKIVECTSAAGSPRFVAQVTERSAAADGSRASFHVRLDRYGFAAQNWEGSGQGELTGEGASVFFTGGSLQLRPEFSGTLTGTLDSPWETGTDVTCRVVQP